MKSTAPDGTTSIGYSRPGADPSTAGAWCGAGCRAARPAPTPRPRRMRFVDSLSLERRWAFSAISRMSPSHGARLRRATATESWAALTMPANATESVWSIVCFFVPRRLRGKGMTRRLIEAAVDHARENGATVVEAYPVDPTSPSYRFMGLVGTFEAMGFREVGRAGIRRHVMRLSL